MELIKKLARFAAAHDAIAGIGAVCRAIAVDRTIGQDAVRISRTTMLSAREAQDWLDDLKREEPDSEQARAALLESLVERAATSGVSVGHVIGLDRWARSQVPVILQHPDETVEEFRARVERS
jgi:hypothetical protein